MNSGKQYVLTGIIILVLTMNNTFAQTQQTTIYCIGDSITWGQAFGSGSDYPQLLNKKFQDYGLEGIRFQNNGVSGDTVGDRLAFWSSASAQRILDRVDVHYATIMLGTNDTRIGDETPTKTYVERLNALIDIFVHNENSDGTTTQVLLSLIPPHNSPAEGEYMASQFRDRFIYRDRIPNELNPEIKRIAEERGLLTIDCYTPLKEAGPDILPDGLHPAAEGNEMLAEAFFEVFLPLLDPRAGIQQAVYEEFR
ncbi:MAG: SGNH/GDSL hydrolase family protein [Candidatus Omnitrophica bacterium]|nr:SGNH/GDSL hydrolase family protein [Candidatus Omnitrophota bacterium]